jgi:hypothetical protein
MEFNCSRAEMVGYGEGKEGHNPSGDYEELSFKLMIAGSIKDTGISGRQSTSWSEENMATVRAMFTRSPGKSTRQAARECGPSTYRIRKVLKEELDFHPWKPHHV